ncbi:MAG: hypothetical protein A2Y73_02220 [Chloroflexi bacterium RBG_13_56_8]|nr:MAG: hypothetical protein A2Y73_02220 [Chloroflexi bacterium RBG_13_56_8]
MAYHILVVDDDVEIAQLIEISLRRQGDFNVTLASNGAEALQSARRTPPDLVILDILMPGMSGYQVCDQLRSDPLNVEVPILFLSAKGEAEDRLQGFRVGADDYVPKPFNIEELVFRVKAVLRRAYPERQPELPPPVLQVGDLTLDTKTFQVARGKDYKILLTPVEFDLLYHLMSNAGSVFSSDQLLQEVWGYPYDTGSPDLVRMHVRNLRRKIEPDPRNPIYVRTIPRHGYTIQVPHEEEEE